MAKKHTVRQGESVIQLSEKHGHFAETIWTADENRDLREQRGDMNELLPGDIVVIPELREGSVSASTSQTHRFRRKGIPAIFRLQLLSSGEPRKQQDYTMSIEGDIREGTTDANGILSEFVPPTAKRAELTIGPDEYQVTIQFGHLDPIEEVSGVQRRLLNLGFNCGKPDGEMNEETVQAIREFQKRVSLEPTGEVDDETRSRLEEIHDGSGELPTRPENDEAAS